MAKAPDLTYSTDGMFVTLIPHTLGGEAAWGAIWAACEGKPSVAQLPGIKSQLRAAGLTIRKGHPAVTVNYDDDLLLADLTA